MDRQIGELSDSEKQEWEVLYEDLQETIKLTDSTFAEQKSA